MQDDAMKRGILAHLAATIAGLEVALESAGAEISVAAAAIEALGDALRAGIPLPAGLLRWATGLSKVNLGRVVDASREEVLGWALPPRLSIDDTSVAFTLKRRDAAESVKIAVVWICLRQRLAQAAVPGLSMLLDELADFDAQLQGCGTRATIEQLLGDRRELLSEHPWTAEFSDSVEEEPDPTPLPWTDAMLAVHPSDQVVMRYVTSGALSQYVEEFAAKSRDFAEELTAVIDALRAAREQVGLTARRWRKGTSAAPPSADVLNLPALPPRASAAATGDDEPAPVQHGLRLGQLSPLPAQARLVASAREVSLRVFAEPGVIERVEFGGAVAEAPDAAGTWSATIARPDAPVRIRVVGTGGDEFDETVTLGEADQP